MKKGFTLVELLAVIAVLGTILILTVPKVVDVVENSRIETFNTEVKIVLQKIKSEMIKNSSLNLASINISFLSQQYNIKTTDYESVKFKNVGGQPFAIIVGKNKWANYTAYGLYSDVKVVKSNTFVENTVAPTITLVGSTPLNIAKGSAFIDPGVTVTDDADNQATLLANTFKEGTINTNILGTYTIKYTVMDSFGNSASVSRTINVLSPYSDGTGANRPELSSGMIAVKWSGSAWIKADLTQNWYNYAAQQWANAVLVSQTSRSTYQSAAAGTTVNEADIMAYFVWIPRFRYQLFNTSFASSTAQKINVVFETNTTPKSSGASNGLFLTHPSFTFGTKELSGFWMGKFETTGTAATPLIKPNVVSLRNQKINAQFTTSQVFNTTTTYGLTTANDAHMVKQMEWAATAYLSQSSYGKLGNPTYTDAVGLEKKVWLNNSSTYTTGCAGTTVDAAAYAGCQNAYNTTNGIKASTTGNITGVYDMCGGSWEYVMGAMFNNDNATIMTSSSGFLSRTIDASSFSKYINKYKYGTSDWDQAAYNRSLLGDGLGETWDWQSGGTVMPSASNAWSWNSRGDANFGAPTSIWTTAFYSGAAAADTGFRVAIISGL